MRNAWYFNVIRIKHEINPSTTLLKDENNFFPNKAHFFSSPEVEIQCE